MKSPRFVARFFGVPVGVGSSREEAYVHAADAGVPLADCTLESPSRARRAKRQILRRRSMSPVGLLEKAAQDARTRLRQREHDYHCGCMEVSEGDLTKLERAVTEAEEGLLALAFRARQRDAFAPPRWVMG